MVTKEDVKAYCEMFGLTYVEAPNAPLDDTDEWPDTVCAGFLDDPQWNVVAIYLMNDECNNVCKVVTAFADGVKHMSDKFTVMPSLKFALMTGTPAHETGEEER